SRWSFGGIWRYRRFYFPGSQARATGRQNHRTMPGNADLPADASLAPSTPPARGAFRDLPVPTVQYRAWLPTTDTTTGKPIDNHPGEQSSAPIQPPWLA